MQRKGKAGSVKHYIEREGGSPGKLQRRLDRQAKDKVKKAGRHLVRAALAGVTIVAAGALATALFFSFRGPRPLPEIPDEFAEAKAQYNEAFQLVAEGRYDGALPIIVAARETWQAISMQHPDVPWIEDYFTRLNRWERVLREWEFAKENEEWSKKRPKTRPPADPAPPAGDSAGCSTPIQ
jgi:hypothetical protein